MTAENSLLKSRCGKVGAGRRRGFSFKENSEKLTIHLKSKFLEIRAGPHVHSYFRRKKSKMSCASNIEHW